jgi:hypothetical protein
VLGGLGVVFEPARCDDWIVSVKGLVHCAITPKLNVEESYAFEDGETETPNATGHEFKRHWVALGVTNTFH